jgi:hypothetical protein
MDTIKGSSNRDLKLRETVLAIFIFYISSYPELW